MTKKNIIILGAGFAGIYAAKKLSRHYKRNPEVTITLIDRHSYFTYLTELHEVAANRVDEDAILYDLQRLFARRKNIQLVTDSITQIDRTEKVVKTTHGSYPYDQVILGIGSESNDFGTPGVDEFGFTLSSWEKAIALKDHIKATVRAGSIEHDAAKRAALLNFVVVGSGFTGTEMIGELRDWRDQLALENKIDPEEIKFHLIEATPTILNMLDRNDAAKAERYMIKRGIKIMKDTAVVAVHADKIDFKDGTSLPTHTLIWTAGVKANTDATPFGLTAGRAGRLVTNQQMASVDDPDIYIVGDLAYVEDPKTGKGQPQIVQGAEQTAETAVKNIIATLDGGQKVDFEGKYSGFMVSIGSKYGVAHLMGWMHLSGFFAMLMKHLVNMLYFIQIFSGYYLVQYIFHEFFRTKNNRNIFRGHISRYGNVLWSVPLRIFYGAMWLVDCWYKVQGSDSWFVDKLRLPFAWLQQVSSGASEAAGAADATTAASGATAATTAAPAAKEASKALFSFSYTYGKEPMMVFDKSPHWFESITKWMIPNQDVAFFFQKFMTILEIIIGLCLVFGLFTWLSSATTVALVAMFCLSGMFYWVNIWMIPVAIALMNGSGRSFGLDFWVVPWLQKHLGHWWYKKPKALYRTAAK